MTIFVQNILSLNQALLLADYDQKDDKTNIGYMNIYVNRLWGYLSINFMMIKGVVCTMFGDIHYISPVN